MTARERLSTLVTAVRGASSMIFAGATIAAVVIMALDRDPPVDVLRAEALQAATESMLAVVNPGDDLVIRYQVSRTRLCRTTAAASIFDGAGVRHYFEPRVSDAVGGLGVDAYSIIRKIPLDARPGLGRYRVVLSYACPWNPTHLIWPIVSVSPDVPFRIEQAR